MKEKELHYQEELFAQKTPYLQWLRQQKTQNTIAVGKQMNRLPFSSCMDSLKSFGKICAEQVYLFERENGKLSKNAEQRIAECFLDSKEVDRAVLVYADEDYVGSLQELYDIKEGDFNAVITTPYQYNMNTDHVYYRGWPWFKPDFSPDTLASFFYVGSVFAIRGDVILETVSKYQDVTNLYELVFWIFQDALNRRQIGKNCGIVHIPEILYTNHNPIEVQRMEISEKIQNLYKVEYTSYKVSIVILSKDHAQLLKKCLKTLTRYTEYKNYEIIVVDNGSNPEQKQCILDTINAHNKVDKEHQIYYLYQRQEFNFSNLCNLGAQHATGEYLLFMNDDVEILDTSEGRKWLDRMMVYAVKSHVGAVGAKLYYPTHLEDDTHYRIQHVGITNMGIGPAHKLNNIKDKGCIYHGRNVQNYNMLAVTAACMLIQKGVFEAVGGFDVLFPVAYNDVELCFRLYQQGYFSVQVNEAVLIHHESFSRGYDDSSEKQKRLQKEKEHLYEKYPFFRAVDPFYSSHLVQWKKDGEYNVNYLYACEKMAEPVLLSNQIMHLIWKERFREKLYKVCSTAGKIYDKMIGRHLLMYSIDNIEQQDMMVVVTGWCVQRKHDNAGLSRQIVLIQDTEETKSRTIYAFALYPNLREDVAELFLQDSSEQKTTNVALSGIYLQFNKQKLMPGTYRIGILIQEKHLLYIKDKTGNQIFVTIEENAQQKGVE